ncbi:Serine/threonine-protein kinase DCLK1 [Holothuria leucospilota]|uniref:Serine/threonine-protein kinase DCLK2 n=1 Tax=Holothuria leucospilota TaxID=206669 RepID=A0A9Q1BK74_HOLLE|nr:Serine/threonine-protein kinase DCLK1 [Holothuria leucospilota]
MANPPLAELSEHFRSSAEKRRLRSLRGSGTVPSPSQSAHGVLIRTSLQRRTVELKAKKVRFYRNGDRFFRGIMYAVSAERFRTFESLLGDLTRTLSDKSHLPHGVRNIFTVDGSRKVTSLSQLVPGESYVCASQEVFKKLDYDRNSEKPWNPANTIKREERDSATPTSKIAEAVAPSEDNRSFIKPRLVTIIKSGAKPRKAVRVLLNKKTAHTFNQVLTDITNAIKLDSGMVKRLYTLDGRQVTGLQDFFQDDDVFIAYGQERLCQDDFDISGSECRFVASYKKGAKKDRVLMSSPRPQRKGLPSGKALQNGSAASSRQGKSRPATQGRPNSASHANGAVRTKGRESPRPSSGSRKDNMLSAVPIDIDQPLADEEGEPPLELQEKYDIKQLIGNGNFAVVRKCTNRQTGEEFALKIINKAKCKGKEQMIENEVSILRRVNHVNIILLIEEFDGPTELYLVMELVQGGDLFDAISTTTKYTERDASCMIHNLFSALQYLHSMNIVHRDIKPENLLVFQHPDGSKSLKLGDFGLATEVIGPLYTVCGTPTYVAPEIILETGYGLKVDIWAAGVITYVLLCGFPPFRSTNNNQDEVFDKIVACDFTFLSPYWDGISESAKELISCMLTLDVDQRYSAEDVLAHPWMAVSSSLISTWFGAKGVQIENYE